MSEPSILHSIRRHLPPTPACPKDWDVFSPIRLQKLQPAVVLFAQVWALKQHHPVPDTFFDAIQALYQYLSAIDEFIQTAHPLDAKTVNDYLPPPVKLHACRAEFITGYGDYLRKRVGIARALKEDFRTRMRELGAEQTREWIIQKRRNGARRRRETFPGHSTPKNLYDAVRDRNCCVVARSRARSDEREWWHGRVRALEEWVGCNVRFDTKCACLL